VKSDFKRLRDLRDRVITLTEVQQDKVAPTKAMQIKNDTMHLRDGSDYKMSDLSHSQLAGWLKTELGVTGRGNWYNGLRRHGLLEDVVNPMFDKSKRKQLLRVRNPITLDGVEHGSTLRALLSDSYNASLDNIFLLHAIIPALTKLTNERPEVDMDVKVGVLTETNMYIQVFFGGLSREIHRQAGHDTDAKIDIVAPSLTFRNSEVGVGSLDIRFGVFRHVCSNMLIAQPLFKQAHRGAKLQSHTNYKIYSDDTNKKRMIAKQGEIYDTVIDMTTDATADKMVNMISDATADEVEVDEIQTYTQKCPLNAEELKQVEHNMIRVDDLSRWGLINGLTSMSQDITSKDRQYDIERCAGDLLDKQVFETLKKSPVLVA